MPATRISKNSSRFELKMLRNFTRSIIGSGTLGIGSSPQWLPSPDGASVALEAEDFGTALATLREHEVPIIIGPLDLPSCQMVTIRDPDGNKLTIHRRKKG